EASKLHGYDSRACRHRLIERFREANNKFPYSWQIDVGEALILGLDCSVIVGTGVGKMMPFAMPLFDDDTHEKIVLVISPLNALEHDQVCYISPSICHF
ncbi:hypothetical protein BKA93DRAFT_743120, partial [Sparassis latifolia]